MFAEVFGEKPQPCFRSRELIKNGSMSFMYQGDILRTRSGPAPMVNSTNASRGFPLLSFCS